MTGNAQGSRLFRSRPTNTTDVLAFTASVGTEITRLLVCNNTGSAATFRVYHLPTGVSASALDYALWYDVSVAANTTFLFGGDGGNAGIHLEEGESIVVRSGTGNSLGFHAYGVTASIAPRGN